MRWLRVAALACLMALGTDALAAGLLRAPERLSSCCCHHPVGQPCPCGDCDLDGHDDASGPHIRSCGAAGDGVTFGAATEFTEPARPVFQLSRDRAAAPVPAALAPSRDRDVAPPVPPPR